MNLAQNSSTNIFVGRIINVNRQSNSFTATSDGNLSSVIRFNVAENARIFDIIGRPINLSSLFPGLRVQVRHASFMTASIPPQTTAFVVWVVR